MCNARTLETFRIQLAILQRRLLLFLLHFFLPKSLKNYHITCTIMYGSNRNGKPIDEFNMCNMTKNTPKCIEYGMLTGLNGSELSTV